MSPATNAFDASFVVMLSHPTVMLNPTVLAPVGFNERLGEKEVEGEVGFDVGGVCNIT